MGRGRAGRRKVAGRTETRVDWATLRSLVTDFQEVTAQAEQLVEASTGLRSLVGPARAQVATREEWVHATSRRSAVCSALCSSAPARRTRSAGAAWPVGRIAAGAEMGVVLGWMSGRVLGQYHLLFAEGGDSPADAVYYVGPNIVALERRHGFDPREFRLWIALHELTHRAQFTGVPWLRAYFLDLVERSVAIASPDRVSCSMRSGAWLWTSVRGATRSPSPGSSGPSPPRAARHAAFHPGDDEPARGSRRRDDGPRGRRLIPSAARSPRSSGPAQSASGFAKFFQQLIGLEAKLRQYADGEKFVREIERQADPELLQLALGRPGEPADAAEIRRPSAGCRGCGGLGTRARVTPRSRSGPTGLRLRSSGAARSPNRGRRLPARSRAGPTPLPSWCWRGARTAASSPITSTTGCARTLEGRRGRRSASRPLSASRSWCGV